MGQGIRAALLAVSTIGFTQGASAQDINIDINDGFRTGAILENDCGDFSNHDRVEFCIKSSAWEMHDLALRTKDQIRESGVGLGTGFAASERIENACDPRREFRAMSETPTTLTEFRDATIAIMVDCQSTLRGVEQDINIVLADMGADQEITVNRGTLGTLRAHTEWLAGLDLSEFEIAEQPEVEAIPQVIQNEDGGLIIQIPG